MPVIRKAEGNMLVLMDTTPDLKHIWGYTEIKDNEELIIEVTENRYCLLPHDFIPRDTEILYHQVPSLEHG